MKPDNYPTAPAHLWRHFFEITRIPRPSGAEAAVRDYVIDQATLAGCACRQDATGNLVIAVPASPERDNHAAVIIQNHLDMVTVKTADKAHDFSRDALSLRVNDGWLSADRTTLGADNGVGCAAALAVMTDPDVQHPPLELLFTVDEETGLNGALGLDASLLTGTRLLNLDTEDWCELYVGCAGGGGWVFQREFATTQPLLDSNYWTLSLQGLSGGHSGIQIHEQLGNAIKLLAQCLGDAGDIQLARIDVGVAHNVIPREGEVTFACSGPTRDALALHLDTVREQALGYLPEADRELTLALREADAEPVLSARDTLQVLDILRAFPHGVQAYNQAFCSDMVDVSINLAVAQLQRGEFLMESSYRFFNEDQSLPLQQSVLALARTFGLSVEPIVGYPGWQPDMDSPLLAQAAALYTRLFGSVAAVKAIHAGLECGILKGKKEDLDILSFGPTIRGAHSPTERLQIDTVEPFWLFLRELLAEL